MKLFLKCLFGKCYHIWNELGDSKNRGTEPKLKGVSLQLSSKASLKGWFCICSTYPDLPSRWFNTKGWSSYWNLQNQFNWIKSIDRILAYLRSVFSASYKSETTELCRNNVICNISENNESNRYHSLRNWDITWTFCKAYFLLTDKYVW